jgi:hypothetical protein
MKEAKRKHAESDNEASKMETKGKKQPCPNKAKEAENTKKQKFQSRTDTAASSRTIRRCVKKADLEYNEVDDTESFE